MNQYMTSLDNTNISAPAMAIAFFYGDSLQTQFYNASYFTIELQQVIKYQKVGTDAKISIGLQRCTSD